MKKKRIGFISESEPKNKLIWSGIKFKLYEQLQLCDADIVWIPCKKDRWVSLYRLYLAVITRLYGKRCSLSHTRFMAKRMSASISKPLVESVDILFAPSASAYLYGLETTKPIIYLTDATFASLYQYYPSVSNYFQFNVKQGNEIEQVALDKATKIISSSDWCKSSMMKDYSIAPEKIHVIEFGANLDQKDLQELEPRKQSNTLNLLFLGVDWERKGGDITVACTNHLNNMGIHAELYVLGVDVPARYKDMACVKPIGFLRKSDDTEYQKFIEIISNSDILLLPTKAECAGVAFCEASAYGLPIFTYDTGGIPNYVENGVNGYRLPLSATGEDFALRIKSSIEKDELATLSEGSKKMYDTKLNWERWRQVFIDEILHDL